MKIDKNYYQKMVDKKFPKQKLRVIEFSSITDRCTLMCGLCGEIVSIRADKYYKTKGDYLIVNCCHSKGQFEKEECLEILRKDKTKKLISFTKLKHQRGITYQCLRCGRKYTKKLCDFKYYPKCYDCEKESQKKSNLLFLEELKDREIIPLEEYGGAYCKIKFRCGDCGFIWKTTPHTILNGTGCPKCNRGVSKGEAKIVKILEELNITYIKEAMFDWSGRYRYDFYLPDSKTLIEYNGIQHYKETNFFRESFEERAKKDELKKKLAEEHNLDLIIISYKKFKVLEEEIKRIVQRPSVME